MTTQLKTLSAFLCLEDLLKNTGNYGLATKQEEGEKRAELRIVDFRVIILITFQFTKRP